MKINWVLCATLAGLTMPSAAKTSPADPAVPANLRRWTVFTNMLVIEQDLRCVI
ncbi:hypothetical protein MGYG_05377 [Nannizzia gypsea CBS 118893]|uniref:Uncharacterized protein n=1 Tax=Arthroderma gypseum (strain ATCC MYA-4604 / CBS 118893) TaxID=535722 RepID=E4UVQ4_ARTGP|nr:hypothetical protein MGYG_05377 [Nannizzia gypsea CBS 118893]EFR02381.1 hypothetical protein MGYG_05377 [Nannizzia gypsea CBS 118893]